MNIIKKLIKRELSHIANNIAGAELQLKKTPNDKSLRSWRNSYIKDHRRLKEEQKELERNNKVDRALIMRYKTIERKLFENWIKSILNTVDDAVEKTPRTIHTIVFPSNDVSYKIIKIYMQQAWPEYTPQQYRV